MMENKSPYTVIAPRCIDCCWCAEKAFGILMCMRNAKTAANNRRYSYECGSAGKWFTPKAESK